jgi:D-alanyl-D-alanine carboxypeptidase
MIVNKKYYLSSTFVPPDLRTLNVPHTNNHPLRNEAATALENMVTAAGRDGVSLRLLSGYRSYATQRQLYASYVNHYGRAAADRFSARPGHSEHQSGLTLDIGDAKVPSCDIAQCFATTPGGAWIAKHAADYGYIIRYTTPKEAVTGYMAEPWHIRYVGVSVARQLVASGLAMEEYFKVAGGGY